MILAILLAAFVVYAIRVEGPFDSGVEKDSFPK
jgi:hypothetical protein